MKYLYCVSGRKYYEMAELSIRSLRKVDSSAEIHFIIDEEISNYSNLVKAKNFEIINGWDPAFPKISYRNNCFAKLIERSPDLFEDEEEIVVVDADVLWHKNPGKIWHDFEGKLWAQIITPLSRFEFNPFICFAPKDIAARTIAAYRRKNLKYKIENRFRINGGLYKIRWDWFKAVIPKFVDMMRGMPKSQIRLSESLLSVVISDLGITPYCHKKDIRIKRRKLFGFGKKRVYGYEEMIRSPYLNWLYLKGPGNFAVLRSSKNTYTGRDVARHFMSGQKDEFFEEAARILG